MKFLNEVLESMQNGFAHAHLGDYLTDIEKRHAIMDVDATQHVEHNMMLQHNQDVAKQRGKRQSIAMFLGDKLSKPLMNYMIETCQSLDNDLLILSFESNSTIKTLIKPYQKELEEKNINFKKVKLSGNPMEVLNSYLKSHPKIAFLACKENGFLGRIYISGNPAKLKLPVPVVVITSDQSESMNTDQSKDNSKDNVKYINAA